MITALHKLLYFALINLRSNRLDIEKEFQLRTIPEISEKNSTTSDDFRRIPKITGRLSKVNRVLPKFFNVIRCGHFRKFLKIFGRLGYSQCVKVYFLSNHMIFVMKFFVLQTHFFYFFFLVTTNYK